MGTEEIEKTRAAMAYLLSDLEIQDEFFSLLFVDIDGKAAALSRTLFETEDRRVALYGPRGIGKSAILRGVAYAGLRSGAPKVPIVCKVSESRSVSSVADIEDRFFTSVVNGIAAIPRIRNNWMQLTKKQSAGRYAPWIANAVMSSASLFIQPLSMVSGVMTKAVESVVRPTSYRSLEEMLATTSVKVGRLSDMLISELEKSRIEPVFVIDELDKVIDPDAIHNFIEGNQTWFEGKNVILTISHNVGESLQKIAAGSIARIASLESYGGMSSTGQGREIISKRASLGLGISYGTPEASLQDEFERIVHRKAIDEIIERAFPSPFRMLRLMYDTLQTSIASARPVEEVLLGANPKATVRVTKQRLRVLTILSNGPLTLKDLASATKVDPRQLYVTLKLMVRNDLLQTTREGRRVFYHMTEEGNRVLRLSSD